MTKGNKTHKIEYRYLTEKDFTELYLASLEAFSDYLVPITLTEPQFENHLAQNGVDLSRSVGAFCQEKMVGYTLNGFGTWNGKRTAYDAGTGVVPAFRKMGIGTALFDLLMPRLRNEGIEQILLEVIEGNANAIGLYRKLGFEIVRKLLFFERDEPIDLTPEPDFEVRDIEHADWNLLRTFWDGMTSWQFSPESVERKLLPKVILGAFSNDICVGYGVINQTSGMVSQIAVDKDHRGRGIGSTLLAHLQMRSANGKALRFGNVDERLSGTIAFFRKYAFKETFAQLEMVKSL